MEENIEILGRRNIEIWEIKQLMRVRDEEIMKKLAAYLVKARKLRGKVVVALGQHSIFQHKEKKKRHLGLIPFPKSNGQYSLGKRKLYISLLQAERHVKQ